MVTLQSKTYKASDLKLSLILASTTKVNMLKVSKKFDLYVSPNIRKDDTACRLANEMLSDPIEIVSRLSKPELQILHEFITGDDTTYVVRPIRKTPYILQKYYLVATYCDEERQEWHMLMPSDIRDSLATVYMTYYNLALQGKKGPSAKELRLLSFITEMYEEDEG